MTKKNSNHYLYKSEKELDARKKRHLKGTSRSYTWEEVKSRARQALKG